MSCRKASWGLDILRLKAELGVRTDSALASALGLERSAIQGWRHRGAVPAKYLDPDRRPIVQAVMGTETRREMGRLTQALAQARGLGLDDALVATAVEAATLRLRDLLHETIERCE